MGCILVMAVRDVEKGRRVAAQIERKTGNQTVEVLGVDFGSLASVKQALDKWHARSPRGRTIDVLINNAGQSKLSCQIARHFDDGEQGS